MRRPAALQVLLVDDFEDAREMYTFAFADAGVDVEHAVDGEHALFKALTHPPDVVVMDLAMPTLDGWEATKRMKAHPRMAHVPIVVLTGQVEPDALRRAHDAGADAVLTKPCSPEALLAVVRSVVGR